jgi:hypothetical protein
MKYLLLLLSTASFAQVEEKRIEIYSYVNGIRSINPTEVIIKKDDKVDIYKVNRGIQNITPYRTINSQGYIFNVDKIGIVETIPISKIEVVEPLFKIED